MKRSLHVGGCHLSLVVAKSGDALISGAAQVAAKCGIRKAGRGEPAPRRLHRRHNTFLVRFPNGHRVFTGQTRIDLDAVFVSHTSDVIANHSTLPF